MPKKNNATEEKKNEGFKEFSGKFNGIAMSGKVWPGKSGKITRSFMHLTLMEGFSITANFVETPNNYFVSFPQYEIEKDGKKEYKSYVYIPKDSEMAKAIDELSECIYNLLK